jgi:hypothetical protein
LMLARCGYSFGQALLGGGVVRWKRPEADRVHGGPKLVCLDVVP